MTGFAVLWLLALVAPVSSWSFTLGGSFRAHDFVTVARRAGKRDSLHMAGGEQDIVERFFEKIFGKKEDSALRGGLSFITPETYPDQYPACLDQFAEPVKGDSRDVAVFRPLLKQTFLEKRALKQVYSGFNAAAFHKAVDKKGPAVIFAKATAATGGAVVGGYNPKGFVGYGEYRPGISAFLFTWPDGDTSRPAIKLRKLGGAGLAVVDNPETGPFFGPDGFCVPMEAGKGRERLARSKLGSYYARLPDGKNSIFGTAGGVVELAELKAFVGVYAPGEDIPFDDAIPFSIT